MRNLYKSDDSLIPRGIIRARYLHCTMNSSIKVNSTHVPRVPFKISAIKIVPCCTLKGIEKYDYFDKNKYITIFYPPQN